MVVKGISFQHMQEMRKVVYEGALPCLILLICFFLSQGSAVNAIGHSRLHLPVVHTSQCGELGVQIALVPNHQLSFWDLHECMTSFLILSITNCPFPPCDDYWIRKSFLCNRQISRLPLATLLCSWLRSSGCYITQLPPHVFHVLCYFLTSSKWTLCFLQCYSVPYTSLNMFLGGDQQDRDSATAYSENISNTYVSIQKNQILLSITHSCCFKLHTCFPMEHKRRNS